MVYNHPSPTEVPEDYYCNEGLFAHEGQGVATTTKRWLPGTVTIVLVMVVEERIEGILVGMKPREHNITAILHRYL